ncbi:Aste57867_13649 [Aphanomyces stellatus]|uniref:Aste57867_13649 protein n=1 Tax=Aphanomyces stellatus TaxID=120398 RepID=A0A485KZ75_9STRA|nr:hypothetical protein As57867_013599 [Aphanomyces stellatus]VFT90485.1 Aste57867_13649 [Aphanomyces stellatus]
MVATNAQLREILRGLDKPPIDKIPDAINANKALGQNPQYGSEIKIQFRIFGIESFSSVLESVSKHIPDSIFQDEPPESANQVSHASTGAQLSTPDMTSRPPTFQV